MNLALDLLVVRRVLVLGAPVILAMLTQTAINIADTIFIGHLTPASVATDGQSAIGISMPLFWMFGGFCAALGVGTQAMVARRHGEGDPEAAGAVLANSLVLTLILSAITTLAGWFLLPALFALMHGDPNVQALGVEYARWRFVGILSMVGTFSLKAFYDGTERTWVHLAAAMVMNVLNIALDWALVFGKLGLPRLGVAGAGIASMIASYTGLVLMLLFTLRRSDRARYRPYRARHLSARQVWNIARLSLPSGAATAVVMTGFLMVLKIVAYIDELVPQPGSVQTAATKIIMDVMSIAFIGAIGLGTATATLVSKSLGERNPVLAERYGWQSIKFGAYLFGLLGLLEFLFPDFTIGLFNQDPAVIDAARDSLRVMAAVESVIAMAIIATQCLFGAGNTRFVMYVEAALHFGLLIPLSYVFGVLLGLEVLGVWVAVACYAAALAAVMLLKFRAGGWKTIRI
ncbi:MAG: MATE family efflux transporter [Deltaproteobacteria bacterium]|nr:MATE family efflux transporter [Deltaproteobacteria bacterium]